jgi:hypothetical protein
MATSMKDAMAEFEAEMQAAEAPQQLDAEKWDKDKRPFLVGKLLECKHIIKKSDGDEFDLITVEEPDGQLTSFAMSMGIRSQWEELLPQTGEVIGVKFHGSVATKSGNSFNQFTLRVMGRDAVLPGMEAPATKATDTTQTVAPDDTEDPFEDQ